MLYENQKLSLAAFSFSHIFFPPFLVTDFTEKREHDRLHISAIFSNKAFL